MPTPEDLWLTLVDDAGEDAVASAATVSASQAERDLTAAGFDVKAERARASAVIAELTGEAPSTSAAGEPASEPTAWVSGPPPSGSRARSSRSVVWFALALAAAATTGGILYAVAHRPKPPEKPVDVPPEHPTASATAAPPSPGTPSAPLPIGPEKPRTLPRDSKVPSP